MIAVGVVLLAKQGREFFVAGKELFLGQIIAHGSLDQIVMGGASGPREIEADMQQVRYGARFGRAIVGDSFEPSIIGAHLAPARKLIFRPVNIFLFARDRAQVRHANDSVPMRMGVAGIVIAKFREAPIDQTFRHVEYFAIAGDFVVSDEGFHDAKI